MLIPNMVRFNELHHVIVEITAKFTTGECGGQPPVYIVQDSTTTPLVHKRLNSLLQHRNFLLTNLNRNNTVVATKKKQFKN